MSRANSHTRLLALSPVPPNGAGCRFRVMQYIPALERAGFSVTVAPFFDAAFFDLVYRPGHYGQKLAAFLRQSAERLRLLLSRDRYDAVFVYREAYPFGPALIEAALSQAGARPLIYDFDDAIFLSNSSDANRFAAALKYPQKVPAIIQRSTLVLAGNGYLAEYARQYSSSVFVLPTCVDTDTFVVRRTPQHTCAPLVVGWIGTPTTATYLTSLGPSLARVSSRHSFELRVSGSGEPLQFPGVKTTNERWSVEREVELFNTCDVGVYPLQDDEWAKGKCGFKAIQFMACGVPVVAAAVGVNTEIIQDGVNGFLASTEREWDEKIGLLLGDAELRSRLGAAGRKTVEERYSLSVNAPKLVSLLKSVVEPKLRAA
ncbi:MAG TPA: glycosyltransferase [Vicinamibacterales bacterium]|nr:glycosyltransferase [Vicinamibacterales bacterium]